MYITLMDMGMAEYISNIEQQKLYFSFCFCKKMLDFMVLCIYNRVPLSDKSLHNETRQPCSRIAMDPLIVFLFLSEAMVKILTIT